MKSLKRYLVLIVTLITTFISFANYADDNLCPRGQYSFLEGENGNELVAKVKLPTSGYKVRLIRGPVLIIDQELLLPINIHIRCDKPNGEVLMVETEEIKSLLLPYTRITLIDKEGAQDLVVRSSPRVAVAREVETKKCSTNKDCNEAEFCDTTPNCPDDTNVGVCILKPKFCQMNMDPVTGCDGKTYSNRCVASAAGQSIKDAAKIK